MRSRNRRCCSFSLTSIQYFNRMMPLSTSAISKLGQLCRNLRCCSLLAEAHHVLHAGPVVPAAIEDHDLSARRQLRDIALHIHLRLLSLGRGRQGDQAEHPRAYPLGDALDDAALPGRIATFEDNDDLRAGLLHPLLQLHQLNLQLVELALVVFLTEDCGSFILFCRTVLRLGFGLLCMVFLGCFAMRPLSPTSGCTVKHKILRPDCKPRL